MGNNKLEKLIYSKIFFFYKTKKGNEELFDSFKTVENGITGKCSGKLKLNKSQEPVHYDSTYEKKILEDLDKCSFVKKIKTQSYKIEYKGKSSKHTRKYIPDVQLLLNDGSIILIEVKPTKEMVNSKNMRKYKFLRKHCKENGFAFAVIDKDYYSFEDIKKEKVEEDIEIKFIEYVKNKNKVSFEECKDFKKRYSVTDKQICNIIYNNKSELIYQNHQIQNKNKKMSKAIMLNIMPYHTMYYRILCNIKEKIINLIKEENYYKCEWIISDELYNMFDKEIYTLSTWSGEDISAEELKERYKYNHKDKENSSIVELYYNFTRKELVILLEPTSKFDNEVLFPIGNITNEENVISKDNFRKMCKEIKQILLKNN